MYRKIIAELNKLKNPAKAKILQRFFKTGPGQYGDGDVFFGIVVPVQRQIAQKYIDASFADIQKLLNSRIHEHRMVALLILTYQYVQVDNRTKKKIYNFYLKNSTRINNWDLVDITAPNIAGEWLLDKKRDVLYKLARSTSLWQRRISILATFTFIKNNDFKDTLKISRILLKDKQDLIHKAVGWMLREIGKRNIKLLKQFLNQYAHRMPRTMLRYSIEKFSKLERKKYLSF